jgi:hypothetical protein
VNLGSEAPSASDIELALASPITLTWGIGITPSTMKRMPSTQVIRLKITVDRFILPSNHFINTSYII